MFGDSACSSNRNADRMAISAGEENADFPSNGNDGSLPKEATFSMIPHNVAFFTIFASRGIVASFFPLYLKQIGLNAQQVGTVMFFRPLGGMIGAVLCPYITLLKVNSEITGMLLFTWLFLAFFSAIPWTISTGAAEFCPTEIWNNHSSRHNQSVPFTDRNSPHTITQVTVSTDRTWLFSAQTVQLAMISCALLICCVDATSMAANSLQHGITLKYLGKENSRKYGLIRAWGALGHATASVGTGLLESTTVSSRKVCTALQTAADYHYIFYIFLGFCALTIVNARNIPERNQEQCRTSDINCMPRNDFFRVICTRTNMAWLFVLFSRSAFYAVTQGFLPWHMENLGASPALIGACHFVTSGTEFFMFFATPKLIQVFGHSQLVNIGLVSYICRFLIFAIISDPLFVLPMEILEGVMFACMFSSLVSYLSNQVPEEGQTQIQGVLQALSMLGNGIGFPVSGLLTQIFGAPLMFLIFDGLAVITFLVFAFNQISCCSYPKAENKNCDEP